VSAKAYITVDDKLTLRANATNSNFLTYSEVWGFAVAPAGKVFIVSSHNSQVVSAQNRAVLVGGKGGWEQWEKIKIRDDLYAFKSGRTNQYLSVEGDRTMSFNSKSIGNAETFKVTTVTGGRIPEDDGLSGYIRNI